MREDSELDKNLDIKALIYKEDFNHALGLTLSTPSLNPPIIMLMLMDLLMTTELTVAVTVAL